MQNYISKKKTMIFDRIAAAAAWVVGLHFPVLMEPPSEAAGARRRLPIHRDETSDVVACGLVPFKCRFAIEYEAGSRAEQPSILT